MPAPASGGWGEGPGVLGFPLQSGRGSQDRRQEAQVVQNPPPAAPQQSLVGGRSAQKRGFCLWGALKRSLSSAANERIRAPARLVRRLARHLPGPQELVGALPSPSLMSLCVKTLPWTRSSKNCMTNRCLSRAVWTVGFAGSHQCPFPAKRGSRQGEKSSGSKTPDSLTLRSPRKSSTKTNCQLIAAIRPECS